MAIVDTLVGAIGNTPLVRLNKLTAGLDAEILLKGEFENPLYSVKDRIGKSMIEAAERDGSLKPGGTIIEATSGNTGIALTFVARAKGYNAVLVMPETVSQERQVLLRMLGAEIVLTPKEKGMHGSMAVVQRLLDERENSFSPRQFENPANPQVHRETTAEEIWRDTEGNIAAFVAGVGTGGTITGVSEVLKERTDLKSFAVEPAGSPVISGGKPGPHKIQGLGAGFIPKVLNVDIIDEVIQVTDDQAFETAQALLEKEGIPAGISTGANVYAALQVAKRPEFAGKRIVTVANSSSERYLSTPLAAVAREELSNLTVTEI